MKIDHDSERWLDRLGIRKDQERRICMLLVEGVRPKQMAGELGMQIRTVKSHLTQLYRRFRINSGVKLIRLLVVLHDAKYGSGLSRGR